MGYIGVPLVDSDKDSMKTTGWQATTSDTSGTHKLSRFVTQQAKEWSLTITEVWYQVIFKNLVHV